MGQLVGARVAGITTERKLVIRAAQTVAEVVASWRAALRTALGTWMAPVDRGAWMAVVDDELAACEGAVAVKRATVVGLVVALGLPLLYHFAIEPLLLAPQLDLEVRALLGYTIMWGLAAAVIGVTLAGEQRPLSTIGLRHLPAQLALLAVGIGILLSLLVPVLSLAAHTLMGTDDGALAEIATGVPVIVLVLGVITAAVTEEVLFRGYALERLQEYTGRWWLAGSISVVVFTVIHLPGWGAAHALGVVLPLGVALTALYLWKRNLLLVMLVHMVIDAPLIVLALIG